MKNRLFTPANTTNSEATLKNDSQSLIIHYSEEELRKNFSGHPKDKILETIAGLEKFIKSSNPKIAELNNYLNEQPRKTLVYLAREEFKNNPLLARIEDIQDQLGITVVDRNPPLIAEYTKVEELFQITSQSVAEAERMVRILNTIAEENVSYFKFNK